ncbi:Tetratricopeptide repeat protein [Symmachiella macrocystis]|uniref:Tetratricopeptide repeat protein n=1 Tax=Symmachiella macrocystis TaxID=2527985 RepID=A0A5C6BQ18_9PLAN|nr:tetratricopeptide repeat protein [Symmachiella macrocystis]TWU13316.1 Tetratricopeptide repeat protein [Symmachiella macrocystis]
MKKFACISILVVALACCGWTAGEWFSTAIGQEAVAERSAPAGPTDQPQLFEGMGPHRRAITTNSPEAQKYFNQALTWMYSFNHDEAIRSFRRAAELDDQCAMAWWGIAFCEGPNYNDEIMTEERSAAAWDALQQAQTRIENTTPVERALIEALGHRYAKPWPEDRTGLEQAYADAMAKVWETYSDDADVGTLYAEALMVQKPWQLYALDQTPAEGTDKIIATLERVMEIEPEHPGANHYYIHAVEPSKNPYRALPSAKRLSDLVPASGHMLHMPSHIHVKTGFWDEAIVQNQKALRSDTKYRARSANHAMQHTYMVHNAHMLAFTSMMTGREKQALAAARATWDNTPPEVLEVVGPIIDLWMCSVYDVQKRFGRWDAILAEEQPPEYLPITTAIWRAHRAVAYAAKKDFPAAVREQAEFRKAKAAIPAEHMAFGDPAHTILEVSEFFIAAEIALQQGDWKTSAELLEQAAVIEDRLNYGEPPQWLQPVRHTLGAVYLSDKRYADAERVYREDLAKWPRNGWSLYGLSRALELQGKTEEADGYRQLYRGVWAQADEPLGTSCKCIPKL